MKIEYIRKPEEIEALIEDLQKDNVNLRLALKDGVAIMKNLYLYSKLEKLYNPREFGLEGDFGGRLFKVAKVKGRNLYFLIDAMHTVIGFIKEVEEVKEENLQCEVCQFVARSKAGLTAHMRSHQ